MIIYLLLIIAPHLQTSDTICMNSFNEKAWKTDSIGCQGKRSLLAKVLTFNKEKIIGHTQKDLEYLLGKPNSMDNHYTFYLIEKGPQCLYPMKNQDEPECKKLMIQYENCKVKNVSIILP